jgi:hypothetical protein
MVGLILPINNRMNITYAVTTEFGTTHFPVHSQGLEDAIGFAKLNKANLHIIKEDADKKQYQEIVWEYR